MDISIKNTTKEQRLEIVKNAFSLSTIDNELPSDKAIQIVKEYIDGKLELYEVQKKILALYKKDGENNG